MWKWVTGIILLWILVTGSIMLLVNGKGETAGQWGDAFGAVNALFSGLAFVVVLFTLKSQEKQLNEQQKEIQKQNETLAKQQLEATFFELVSARTNELQKLRLGLDSSRNADQIKGLLHHEPSGAPYLQGADVIGFLITNEIIPEMQGAKEEGIDNQVGQIRNTFRERELYYSNLLSSYLGSTLSLYEYLDSNADLSNQAFYKRHARLKQSPSEAMLLAVYAVFAVNSRDYKRVVTKYGLLSGFESKNPLMNKITELARQPD